MMDMGGASGADPRRREAGAFLRTRRARLAPRDVGLPDGARRRVPGLRREEVAMLAGVGTTWYTFLEQGRDVSPSDEVLGSLAGALLLDADERRHLFTLHGRTLPAPVGMQAERIDATLRRMLDSLTGQPAFVLGRTWDMLGWNAAADVVFGPYSRLAADARNAIHLLFANREHRRLLVDWEPVARATLAMFRAETASLAGDPGYERLVARLAGASPEFARWWRLREVARPHAGVKRIDHPKAGRMAFEHASFGVGEPARMKLIVFTPLEAEDTAGKLARLLRGARKRASGGG